MLFRLLLPLLLSVGATLCGQAPPPPHWDTLAADFGVELLLPEAADFRTRQLPPNDYLADHHVLYSKPERLEVRTHLRPVPAGDPYFRRPHLAAGLLQMNLGSNEEDAITAVHSFGEEELAVLNADWARLYTFRPKRGYGAYQHAQLVALYREDRGLAYLLLLFDRTPDTVEDRQLMLRFR